MATIAAIAFWLFLVAFFWGAYVPVGGPATLIGLPASIYLQVRLDERLRKGESPSTYRPCFPSTSRQPYRPPSRDDRQLTYIDALMTERDVPDSLLEGDVPATMDEANELIDELLDLPYRDRCMTRTKRRNRRSKLSWRTRSSDTQPPF